jgi:hypothetical protein
VQKIAARMVCNDIAGKDWSTINLHYRWALLNAKLLVDQMIHMVDENRDGRVTL